MRIALLFALLICNYSCTNDVNFIECTMESFTGDSINGRIDGNYFRESKFPNVKLLSKDFSRSGQISIKISSDNPFALTYIIPEVKEKEHFRFSVWEYGATNYGNLVVRSDNPNDFYIQQRKSKKVEKSKWELITFDVYVNELASKKNLLVYLWNDNLKPAWFDDLRIEKINDAVKINSPISTYIDPRDGNRYTTVKIGNNYWLAQNLRFNSEQSLVYDSNEIYTLKQGRLYNFKDAKNSVPLGWKLPTDVEWMELERSIGMADSELEDFGFRGYNESITLRENGPSGFNALLSGTKNSNSFYFMNRSGYFWTSTETDTQTAICREIGANSGIGRFTDNMKMYFSVRCIKK